LRLLHKFHQQCITLQNRVRILEDAQPTKFVDELLVERLTSELEERDKEIERLKGLLGREAEVRGTRTEAEKPRKSERAVVPVQGSQEFNPMEEEREGLFRIILPFLIF
jgi:hypothetical protein